MQQEINYDMPEGQQPEMSMTVPDFNVTPGWKTSQGQMTGIFTVICMVLAVFGYTIQPESIVDWVTRIETIALAIIPILTALFSIITYINSRGKIASNAINAKAHVMASAASSPPQVLGQVAEFTSGGLLDDKTWKDPKTYEKLIHIASEVGVPGMDKVDAVNQQIKPADLLIGILGMFKNRDKNRD